MTDDRALVDAYLVRAATLTPVDWGRLDARGARLSEGAFAWLDQAQLDGAVFGLWSILPRSVATGSALAVRGLFRAAMSVFVAANELTDPAGERMRQRVEDQERGAEQRMAAFPEERQIKEDIAKLSAICAKQPGLGGAYGLHTNAGRALHFGLLALRNRPRLTAAAFESVYLLVEPVIPFSTLAARDTPFEDVGRRVSDRVTFAPYEASDLASCLAIFDANVPEYFSPVERPAYLEFLGESAAAYEVCRRGDRVVGAFGIVPAPPDACHIRWIMLAPEAQGKGIGSTIMARVADRARAQRAALVRIAASHRSAPFFERFGARVVKETQDGWGPGMHRVDMEWQL